MKVCAGILEYCEPEGLDRCLKSLKIANNGVGFDGACIIHGKFPNFDIDNIDPDEAFRQTLAVAEKYPSDKVHLLQTTGMDQIQMRNKYFELAAQNGYDYVLVLDADEYIAPNANFAKFRSQLEFVQSLQLPHQIFDVMFEGSVADRGPRPRLFFRPATIKYWNKHYWWVLEESKYCYKGMSDSGRILEGVYIIEDKTIRDANYFKASYYYVEWQKMNEGRTSDGVQIV